jgi:signal transduction histidine kinase
MSCKEELSTIERRDATGGHRWPVGHILAKVSGCCYFCTMAADPPTHQTGPAPPSGGSDPSRQLERIPRKIVTYSVLYTLAALLLISFLSIFPLVENLKEAEERNLLHAGQIRAMTVEEYLLALRNDVLQVISLVEDTPDSLSRLEDGLSLFMAGITRVDGDGGLVAQIGQAIPRHQWWTPPADTTEVLFGPPVVTDGRLYLLAARPILNGEMRRIGVDLILFHPHALQRILWHQTGLLPGGEYLLGRATADGGVIFFPGRMGIMEVYNEPVTSPSLMLALQRAAAGQSGLLYSRGRGNEPYVVAYVPIGATDWGLLVPLDQGELFARVNRTVWRVAGTVLLLTMFGGLGIGLLLRPLSGRAMTYARQLDAANRDLQQEVAERSRAEEELRRSEREWQQTFEAITDSVAILDRNGRILKMNKATVAFLEELSPERMSGQRCSIFSGEGGMKGCPFTRMLASGRPEMGEFHDEKTDRYFHIAIYPLTNAAGEVWGGVHVAQEISDQKKLEKMKDEMLSAVSHEMRTPLTAMLGFVEYLLENEVEPQQTREFLRTVHRETERLSELISNFLDLQRLQAELENYSFEELHVLLLLSETVQLFAKASRKHPVVLDCPADLPLVRGDNKRLQQVLKNLLTNAIRYSPEGGQVTVGARQEGQMITIFVQDQGMGIPHQALNRIFDRFYRVDDSARRIPGGIGLGLALVREVIRAHGGTIWVESALGKGSTFYFTLPVAE